MKEKLPETQDQSYSQMAYSTVSSYLSWGSSTLTSYVWSNPNSARKPSFGPLQAEAEDEMNRFNN